MEALQTLEAVELADDETINLRVKTMDSSEILVSINQSDSILKLKQKI